MTDRCIRLFDGTLCCLLVRQVDPQCIADGRARALSVLIYENRVPVWVGNHAACRTR